MYADLKQKKADTRTPSSKLLKKDYSLTENDLPSYFRALLIEKDFIIWIKIRLCFVPHFIYFPRKGVQERKYETMQII